MANLGCYLFPLIHHYISSSFKISHDLSHCCNFNLIQKLVPIIRIIFDMPKTADYLNILSNEEGKDCVVINFGQCFRPTREEWYSKLGEKKS